jgi:hypothetical protein
VNYKKSPSFLFYVTFYKCGALHNSVDARQADIICVTYAPFIMHKLISGTLVIENLLVTLKISDQGEYLYDERNS